MKIISPIFNALKFIISWLVTLIVIGLFATAIGYVLYGADLVVGIVFMIILGLVVGYFAVIIKSQRDKKKRESNIDKKIEEQKFQVTMTDIKEELKDPTSDIPQIKKALSRKPTPPKVKKVVKKPVKKANKKGKTSK